jgi:hypothetical protein
MNNPVMLDCIQEDGDKLEHRCPLKNYRIEFLKLLTVVAPHYREHIK